MALALLLFLPAWTLRFWEAWLYWAVFSLAVILITLHFLEHDPGLIGRRLEAGLEPAGGYRALHDDRGAARK